MPQAKNKVSTQKLKNLAMKRVSAALERSSAALKPNRKVRPQISKRRVEARDSKPFPPLPKQTLRKPGVESELELKPQYLAPSYRGSEKLAGKVALITGGDSGIGRAVAVLYAREGADVAIIYLNEHSDAKETQKAVESEGKKAIIIPGDVSNYEFCCQSVNKVIKELGKIDILVNNAAYQEHTSSLEELNIEKWDHTFKTNIYGYFYMAKAALPFLRSGSVIINTGSVTGIRGSGKLLDYSSTKGAIHAFTKSLAQNLIEKGIRVNAVAPGPVWTPLNPADQTEEGISQFGSNVPMKRPAQPEELAPSYVFLATAVDSSYITGEVLPVLGGEQI